VRERDRNFVVRGGAVAPARGGFVVPGGGFARRRRGEVYPDSAGSFTAITGLTAQSLYLFREASGNLLDVVGSNHLPVGGAPAFNTVIGGRRGIKYDTNGDSHRADVHDFAAASGWFAAVVYIDPAIATAQVLIGRTNSPFTAGVAVYVAVPAAGQCAVLVRDNAAGELLVVPATDMRGKVFLVQCQVDRAAATVRYRASVRGGSPTSTTGAIAGFATLTEAGQLFGFGTLPSFVASNVSVSWAAVATGVQCEGASLLANIARRMGFE
jgi:hypothetical protein